MIDINLLRQDLEKFKKSLAAKQVDPKLIDKALELDKKRRELIARVEVLRKERNEAAREKDIEKGKKVKSSLQKIEPELKKLDEEFLRASYQIPNPPAEDVKTGKDDSENEVLRKVGKPKNFDFKVKDHLELGEALDIIDVKRAAKVSGARFGYLKGDAVLLEFALVQFAMETLIKEGFKPVVPPVLIKKESMEGMGYLEHGGQEDMFTLPQDGLILVGTSEQSIGPMHQGEVFNGKDLPVRYAAFSSCFRREAGSYGKDTKGILRVHQFDKVEMFSYTTPDKGDKEHDYLLSLEEKFLQALEIPYQVVKMCSGDLGAPAARKYDLEGWIPSQDKYRELTSTSTTTDFQARRLDIKYQEGGKTEYVHMLNGTAFAIGRTIIAILENNQEKDGTVAVPKVLQKWLGKEKIG